MKVVSEAYKFQLLDLTKDLYKEPSYGSLSADERKWQETDKNVEE